MGADHGLPEQWDRPWGTSTMGQTMGYQKPHGQPPLFWYPMVCRHCSGTPWSAPIVLVPHSLPHCSGTPWSAPIP